MRRGFTLIELMVVMTVISILSSLVLYGFTSTQKSARDAQRTQTMTGLQAALERYYGDNQVYPPVPSAANFSTMVTALITGGYLSAVPLDPSKSCTSAMGATWVPCSSAAIPSYSYTNSGISVGSVASTCPVKSLPQAYQLVLRKESGGVVYFCSP